MNYPDRIVADDPQLMLNSLEQLVDSLARENENLRKQLKPADCSLDSFLIKLNSRRGHIYGWKTAYVTASKQRGCRSVSLSTVTRWAWSRTVPDWAIEQLDRMKFSEKIRGRTAPPWTQDELRFLAITHLADCSVSNNELARLCTEKFGRHIGPNAIRGRLHRLRLNKVVPRYRYPVEVAEYAFAD